jgi:hypothetical protein
MVCEMVGEECSDRLTPSVVAGVPARWGNTTMKEEMPCGVIEHRISGGIDPKQLGFSPIDITYDAYPWERGSCAPQIGFFPVVLDTVGAIKQDSSAYVLLKTRQETGKLLETGA